MKTIIFLTVLTFVVFTPKAHALFGHVAQERQRRIETEQKLERQQQAAMVQQQRVTTHWQMASFALGSGVVVALVIGTAIGSKARRDHETSNR